VIKITEEFKKLNDEKKEKILNAAFKEFGEQGYEKASTNNIVKEAGISKGILFYYFNNKNELFNDLIDISLEIMNDDFFVFIDENQTDFIEKLRQLSILKFAINQKNPFLFQFAKKIYIDNISQLSDEIIEKFSQITKLFMAKLYVNIDESLFKPNIPKDYAMKMIQWCMSGYENELTEKLKNLNLAETDISKIWDEFYVYLDALKIVFYA